MHSDVDITIKNRSALINEKNRLELERKSVTHSQCLDKYFGCIG